MTYAMNTHTNTHTPAPVLPSPQLASVCPRISEGSIGLCVEACSNDDSCQGDQICCSNGCGRSCVDPDRIPYYDIPRQCPTSEDSDLTTGTCVLTNASCLTNDQCDDGELCCQSGCGRRLVMGNINYVISLEGEVNTRFVGYTVPPQERPKKKKEQNRKNHCGTYMYKCMCTIV